MNDETSLDRYKMMAESWLRQYFPARYQQTIDLPRYLDSLARRIENRVKAAETTMISTNPNLTPSPSRARHEAERSVCSDLSWLFASPDPYDPSAVKDETGAYLGWSDPNLRLTRTPKPDFQDWELMDFDQGRDPATGQPLLSDEEISRLSHQPATANPTE